MCVSKLGRRLRRASRMRVGGKRGCVCCCCASREERREKGRRRRARSLWRCLMYTYVYVCIHLADNMHKPRLQPVGSSPAFARRRTKTMKMVKKEKESEALCPSIFFFSFRGEGGWEVGKRKATQTQLALAFSFSAAYHPCLEQLPRATRRIFFFLAWFVSPVFKHI